MAFLNDNEQGGDYWLAWYLDEKQTFNISITNDEKNHILVGSMVVKGEYLTEENNIGKKGEYIFIDYKSGASVYHFRNLIIMRNVHLQMMPKRNFLSVQ